MISSCILIFGVYCVKLKIPSNKVFKSHLELYFYFFKKRKSKLLQRGLFGRSLKDSFSLSKTLLELAALIRRVESSRLGVSQLRQLHLSDRWRNSEWQLVSRASRPSAKWPFAHLRWKQTDVLIMFLEGVIRSPVYLEQVFKYTPWLITLQIALTIKPNYI